MVSSRRLLQADQLAGQGTLSRQASWTNPPKPTASIWQGRSSTPKRPPSLQNRPLPGGIASDQPILTVHLKQHWHSVFWYFARVRGPRCGIIGIGSQGGIPRLSAIFSGRNANVHFLWIIFALYFEFVWIILVIEYSLDSICEKKFSPLCHPVLGVL